MNPEIFIKKRKPSPGRTGRVFCMAAVASIFISAGFPDTDVKPTSEQPAVAAAPQQETTVTGTVTDDTGAPVPGVNVFIKGTTNGTVTGVDGKYSLTANGASDQIVFSFIGYQTQTIAVDGQRAINVSLTEDSRAIEEVVVVGHGTQKKVNLTGAVSQVSSQMLENRPVTSLTRGLQGLIPNLNIVMSDGSPTRTATYNVRGLTSVGFGGSALILIDDVEGDPNLINPNDIESISVLKDASSAAIYGSRAAFGVVLITTKTPLKDRVRVNVNSNYSINRRTVVPKLITNGYAWAENFDEAFNAWYDYKSHPITVNANFPFSLEYLEALKEHDENPSLPEAEYDKENDRYVYYGNTDWDAVLHKKNIFSTEQSVSASGGAEKVNYYVSGRYYRQDGIFNRQSDDYNKYNIRAKGTIKMTDWLDLQENFDYTDYSFKYPLLSGGDNTVWRMGEVSGFPIAVVNNPDGTYTMDAAYMGFEDNYNNYSDLSSNQLRSTTGLVARLFNNKVRLKGDFTYSKTSTVEKRVNSYLYYSNTPDVLTRMGSSRIRQYDASTSYYGSNITGEYRQKFQGRHEVGTLLGFNIENSSTKNTNISRDNLLVESRPDFSLMDGLNYGITGGGSEWSFIGLFYRLNYVFDDRYLVEFNGRYDGSSKFPEIQRYGFFPSVSAGWRISEEEFMAGTRSWLTNLKLRGSYGALGNGNVAPYRFIESMGVAKSGMVINGVQQTYTSAPGVLPDGLTWEKSTTLNFGVDVIALQNRLSASFDWYNRLTTDMFTRGQPLPGVFGAAIPNGNYADLSTTGWELTLSWINDFDLGGKPFQYMVSGSLWDNTSKITRFNNPENLLSTYYEGQKIGEIWGYETLGLFRSDDEPATHADQSFIQNSNNKEWLAGDLKFADLNSDGFINQGDNTADNPGDRKIIGNSAPRYQFGFNLGASYRGFSILAFFQGVAKRDWYFAGEAGLFWGPYNRPYGYQPVKMMENIWSEENPDGYFPRYRGYTALNSSRSLGAPQTRYLQDASYIRLKSLTLEYTLPRQIVQKLKMENMRIFLTGQNIFTASGLFKYTDNFDPEVIENPQGGFLNGNGQGYAYPMLKSYTVGFNITF